MPFTSAENALENINAISEGQLRHLHVLAIHISTLTPPSCSPSHLCSLSAAPCAGEATQFLLTWLETSLPKPGKKSSSYLLGVLDSRLGAAIKDALSVPCVSSKLTDELLRGVRLHFTRFIKALQPADLHQAQLGLSHSYSRSKVKFNVHRVDNMIIQSSALLDQLDKDLNTFAMRVREWYSWHFPELVAIVNDNLQFAQCCQLIQNKATLSPASLPRLAEITGDEEKARAIVEAAKMSMGTDISPIDLVNIEQFAERVVELGLYRRSLHAYLVQKMNLCAPNLSALIGEQVGARLISHAGSLTNLAKYPASTVQILGAEKALFRALKTKGATPKYGLIFHSTFIGRAATKNKGRISRYLANKCSLASRIDSFSEGVTAVYGVKLREQVEERLEFYKTGTAPKKNVDVMMEAVRLDREKREEGGGGEGGEGGAAAAEPAGGETEKERKKRLKREKKKQQAAAEQMEDVAPPAAAAAADGEAEAAPSKKDKKKRKAEAVEAPAEVEEEEAPKKAKSSKKDRKAKA